MGEVDWEARRTAYKVLLPMVIVISLLLHFGLAYKMSRRTGHRCRSLLEVASGPRGPRDMILLSLLIGNIIVSVFPLTLQAYRVYADKDYPTDDCESFVVPATYLRDVMPAVNAGGLVLLVAEGVYFRRRAYVEATRAPSQAGTFQKNLSQTMASFIAGAVPWGHGILLILPLVLTNYDFDLCELKLNTDEGRTQAQVSTWLSVILPCSFAVFVALGNLFVPRCLPISISRNGPQAGPTSSSPLPGSTTYSASGQVNMIPDKPSLSDYISSNEPTLAVVAAFALFNCCVPAGFYQIFYDFAKNRKELDFVIVVVIWDISFWLVTLSSCVMSTVWLVGGRFKPRQN